MKINSFWRKFFGFWNLLPCPCCMEGDGSGANEICPRCLERFAFIRPPRCPMCGGANDGALGVCPKCLRSAVPRPWVEALAVFEHRNFGRDQILRFKYGNSPLLARPFAVLAAGLLRDARWPVEKITSVPSHFLRKLSRGYNQAELFGRSLAEETDMEYQELLTRTRFSRHQASLRRRERIRGVKNLFRTSRPELVRGKIILLVDDVLTTGATLTEAAQTLLDSGASAVYILVIART